MTEDHVDVLIVGAGLSGIGAAHHLVTRCPGKTYAVLESRGAIGGTWDLFRYPGVRSDSDMFTLGYRLKPWTDAEAIADGPAILRYVRETAAENGIDRHIRFGHKVVRAEWSSDAGLWTVDAERTDTGESVRMTCGFLFSCSGYYDYDRGYAPEFAGSERFGGEIVHPQHWPEDLDYAGKRVVVIGSGATAVTLVPAMAPDAAHVTMLQRSPSYVVALPGTDPLATLIRRVLPLRIAYPVIRWINVLRAMAFFELSRRRPGVVKSWLKKMVARRLPEDFDVDRHFTPAYNPWDQRICLVPDGDLFEALADGSASVVTDRIETFTETGIELVSGETLEADVIVTATGLNMVPIGGLELAVDGERVELPSRLIYRGMMLEGVPNYAFTIGYTNASWTLKADLVSGYVCRLLNHMDAAGHDFCRPRERAPAIAEEPAIDFSSGYVQRAIGLFPRQGSELPWRLRQNYPRDLLTLRRAALDDGVMEFGRKPADARSAPVAA